MNCCEIVSRQCLISVSFCQSPYVSPLMSVLLSVLYRNRRKTDSVVESLRHKDGKGRAAHDRQI